MHPEIQIHKAGDGEALIDWYNEGAGGKVQWGQPGDFEACVAIAGKYLDNPEGFCQLRHIDATGEPAGRASGEIGKASEPDYTQLMSDRKGKPTDQELYEQVKTEAKSKFDTYPSAVANGWVVQEYKRRGGKYRKPTVKSAPFSGRFASAPTDRTQTYIEQARSCAERADGFRRLEKWQSAAFAHNDAADAYRKAATGETDGNAEILNAQADAQDHLAKYCEFLDRTPQNSPAEIGKAHGDVPAYPGTSYENPPFKAGAQNWGWLGEGLSTKTPEYNYAPTGDDLPDESSAEPHSDWQSEDAQ